MCVCTTTTSSINAAVNGALKIVTPSEREYRTSSIDALDECGDAHVRAYCCTIRGVGAAGRSINPDL